MNDASSEPSQLTETKHRRQLKRAVVASTIGSVIEALDFLLSAPSPGSCSPGCISQPRTH
jgi:hypothetical protein